MPIGLILNKGKVPVKIYTQTVESHALDQLANISKMPFIHNHIAAMPDVHMGIGATIGSVIPTKGAIIPAAVGVDIGCGMNATRLSIKAKDLPDNLKKVRLAIEEAVPVGFAMHKSIKAKNSTIIALNKVLEEQILPKHPALIKMMKNIYRTWTQQLGSLGGGNHFIEVCLDENQDVWVMLHSGSRGIGNVMGRYFISLAKKDMEQHLAQLPHKDLAYFTEGAKYFDDYMEAVHCAPA
ncbi:RtcB family protein, partial [Thiotrichales bacterium HSG1]|nr:RtcB family protein [Thiotrichales bacterium HSG1]